MTAIPFAIATTAAHPAAAVSRVPIPSGGLEIRGSVAVQAEEGLSRGGVRRRTQRAALPAVAGVPDAHGHAPRQDARGKAYDWFKKMRWLQTGGVPYCPKCGTLRCHTMSRGRFKCSDKACRAVFTVTSGTVFASRKLSFKKMLVAIWFSVNSAKGKAALQLSREIGVQYRTAWVIGHRHSARHQRMGDRRRDTRWIRHPGTLGCFHSHRGGGVVARPSRAGTDVGRGRPTRPACTAPGIGKLEALAVSLLGKRPRFPMQSPQLHTISSAKWSAGFGRRRRVHCFRCWMPRPARTYFQISGRTGEHTSPENPYVKRVNDRSIEYTTPWQLEWYEILLLIQAQMTNEEKTGAQAFKRTRDWLSHGKAFGNAHLRQLSDWWERLAVALPSSVPGWDWPRAGQRLMMTVGPAAAGKSTWAATQGSPVISTDSIRMELGGSLLAHEQGPIFRMARKRAIEVLRTGADVVPDATHIRTSDRIRNARMVPDDCPVEYVVIDRDLPAKVASQGARKSGLVEGASPAVSEVRRKLLVR
jgi:predicted kinase